MELNMPSRPKNDDVETQRLLTLAATMRRKAAQAPPHMRRIYLSLAAKCESQLYGSSPPVFDAPPPRVSNAPKDSSSTPSNRLS